VLNLVASNKEKGFETPFFAKLSRIALPAEGVANPFSIVTCAKPMIPKLVLLEAPLFSVDLGIAVENRRHENGEIAARLAAGV
jgi:hypothetical protein